MEPVLLIDIGSTFTKVCSLDMYSGTILGTAQSGTTVEDDVCIGIENATKILEDKTHINNYKKKLACSSAAGGLAVMVSGLVESLTLKAAKLAAMGAGAKIIRGFHHQLTSGDIKYIIDTDFDIFILAGGTDGGNDQIIIENAHKLAGISKKFPVVIAGNRTAAEECGEILAASGKAIHICPNILPRVDELNIRPVNEIIRKLFTEQITKAKGISKAEKLVDGILMPTPFAVLSAVTILSEGVGSESGLGEIMGIDVGGATTDVHSVCEGYNLSGDTIFEGFAEPYIKRTVEGDLGVRYNAGSIVDAVSDKPLNPFRDREALFMELEAIKRNPWLLFGKDDPSIDDELCSAAVRVASARHCGTVERRYTSNGIRYIQRGKDLSQIKAVIGTGGVLVNSPKAAGILSEAAYNGKEPDSLRPKNPEIYIDKKYILPAMGLLSTIDPGMALKVMKKEIIKIQRGSSL